MLRSLRGNGHEEMVETPTGQPPASRVILSDVDFE